MKDFTVAGQRRNLTELRYLSATGIIPCTIGVRSQRKSDIGAYTHAMRRWFFLIAVVFFATSCDSYIEEARVQADGQVEFVARAIVVCGDSLQQAMWGEDPCERIDGALRGGDVDELPFGFDLDPDRVSLVGTGEADRRTIDISWDGAVEEMSTLLVSHGRIESIDEFTTEAVFVPAGSPALALRASTDPEIVDELRRSRWSPANFRIKVPGRVTEHNADRLQGDIVIWDIDRNSPEEFRVVWSTEERARRWWWWVVGSVILTAILMMMITLEGPAREAKLRKRGDTSS